LTHERERKLEALNSECEKQEAGVQNAEFMVLKNWEAEKKSAQLCIKINNTNYFLC
jgi:hypothetical protein